MSINYNPSWIQKASTKIIFSWVEWERKAIEIQDKTYSEEKGFLMDGHVYLKQKIQETIAKEWLEYETEQMMEQLYESRDKGLLQGKKNFDRHDYR